MSAKVITVPDIGDFEGVEGLLCGPARVAAGCDGGTLSGGSANDRGGGERTGRFMTGR